MTTELEPIVKTFSTGVANYVIDDDVGDKLKMAGGNADVAKRNLSSEIEKLLKEKLNSVAVNALEAYNKAGVSPQFAVLIIDKYGDGKRLMNEVNDHFNALVLNAVESGVKRGSMGAHVNLSDNKTYDFYKYVSDGWNNTSEDVRDFYRNFLSLLESSGGGEWRDADELGKPVAPSERANYRLNLKKSRDTGVTLFETALPLSVASPPYEQLWYTDSSGQVKRISMSGSESGVFHMIYHQIYNGDHPGTVRLPGGVMNVPEAYSDLRRIPTQFSTNPVDLAAKLYADLK
jgi:hypothetical protein